MNSTSSNYRLKTIGMIGLAVLLFVSVAGVAFCSSGGEHGEVAVKHWMATDWARVLNFVVLFVILFFVLRKPVAEALNGRIKSISEQLDELDKKKVEAEKRLADYSDKLALLNQEAEKIVEQYVQQGNEAKERILTEAKSAAVKLEEQAKRNIEHEFEKAKSKLQHEIFEKAMIKAEDLIKKSINVDDQNRLIDEYLQKVVAQ